MHCHSDRKRILTNCVSGGTQNVLSFGVALWMNQYLIKRISAGEYSLYPLILAVFAFMPLLNAVLTSGIGRFVTEAHAKHDDQEITRVASTMFPLLLGVATTLMVGGFLFARYVGAVLTIEPGRVQEAQIMLCLLVFSMSARLALAPFSLGLFVTQRFMALNALSLCSTVLRAILLLVLLIGISPRVLWVVVASVTADLVVLLTTTFVSTRLLPTLRFRRREIHWPLLRTLTTFGFWNTLAALAYLIRKSADPIILNKLATAPDVAAFYLGNLPDNQIDSTLQRATAPLQPAMVTFQATGRKDRIQELYLRGGRYGLWAALFVAVPLLVFRQELWSLYLGGRYAMYKDAATVMALLLLRHWIHYPNEMIFHVAYATNQVKPFAIRWMVAALVNLGLTIYFVHALQMGAVGSAMGTFIATVVWEPLVMWRLSMRLVNINFGKWFHDTAWLGSLPSILTVAFLMALKGLMHPVSWLDLSLIVASGCALYLGVLITFCLKPDERQGLLQVRHQLRSLVLPASPAAGTM